MSYFRRSRLISSQSLTESYPEKLLGSMSKSGMGECLWDGKQGHQPPTALYSFHLGGTARVMHRLRAAKSWNDTQQPNPRHQPYAYKPKCQQVHISGVEKNQPIDVILHLLLQDKTLLHANASSGFEAGGRLPLGKCEPVAYHKYAAWGGEHVVYHLLGWREAVALKLRKGQEGCEGVESSLVHPCPEKTVSLISGTKTGK